MMKHKRGFSLVELLVVVGIIATLLAVLLPNLMGARQKAKDAAVISDLDTVKNSLRFYYNDNETYPPGNGVTDLSAELLDYLPGIASIGYTYYQTNAGDGFQLCAGLESGGGNDDTNSQIRCGAASISVCGLGIGVTQERLYVNCVN